MAAPGDGTTRSRGQLKSLADDLRRWAVVLRPTALLLWRRSRGGNFPSGLRNLTDYLGAPLVMHFGELVGNSSTHPDCGNPPCGTSAASGAPPYSKPSEGYPGAAGWVVGTEASLPLGPDGGAAFWNQLFKDAADWGLMTFSEHTAATLRRHAAA